MLWTRLFLPLAAGYCLSFFFRSANAITGPLLSTELSFNPADLGLLTSTYFLAFSLTQLPLGMMLDRFGVRRVEAFMLLFAAAGAMIFASGSEIGTLAIGRGLIGLGASVCLMSAFKAFSQWYPPEKQASMVGWIMSVGMMGGILASTPLDAVLKITGWRPVFWTLSVIALLISAWVFLRVPDKPIVGKIESMAEQWSGIKQILTHRHFWRFAPFSFALTGGYVAIHSLWSSAWLMNVNGFSRQVAASHYAWINIAMIIAYMLIGLLATRLARRGLKPVVLFGMGIGMSILMLLLIITQASDQHYLLWAFYGAFSSFGTLSYSITASGFAVSLAGRVNTLINLMAFIGAFIIQWGIGLIITRFETHGYGTDIAHRHAFTVLLVIQALAYGWFLLEGRHAAKKKTS